MKVISLISNDGFDYETSFTVNMDESRYNVFFLIFGK